MKRSLTFLMIVVFLGSIVIANDVVSAQSELIASDDAVPPPNSPEFGIAPNLILQVPASPTGYLLGPEIEISPQITPTDPDRYHPSAAYNNKRGQYLVVWHNTWASGHDREVIGQRVDGYGHLVGSNFPISSGSHDRIQPAVAYNPTDDDYMVVWMYDVNGDGKKFEIWGAVVSWDGVVGTPFQIQTYPNTSFWSPEIAWNSQWNEYAVVWGSIAQDTQIALDIGLKALHADGSYIYGTVLWSDGLPSNPDITFDSVNHNFLVVWNYVNTSGKTAIKGDLRNADYNRVRLVDVFGSTTNHALFPRVDSSMGIFFLVTFEYENSASDHDIYVAFVNKDATGSAPAAFVSGTTHDVSPDVAGSQQRFEFMIAYQRADVNGAKVLLRPLSNYFAVERYRYLQLLLNKLPESSRDPRRWRLFLWLSGRYTYFSIGDPATCFREDVFWPDGLFTGNQ